MKAPSTNIQAPEKLQASSTEKACFNARPHPGPLPRGEGESFAVFLKNLSLHLLGVSLQERHCAFAAPSPGGEGGRQAFLSNSRAAKKLPLALLFGPWSFSGAWSLEFGVSP
jgi:hypothetical protein